MILSCFEKYIIINKHIFEINVTIKDCHIEFDLRVFFARNSLSLNMKTAPSYIEDVYEVTRLIPAGKVTTYGAIANYLSLGSARMVGWALNKSFTGDNPVPAHRVVNRKGELSGRVHFPTPTMMQELLESEGIEVENDTIIDFKKKLWNPSIDLE